MTIYNSLSLFKRRISSVLIPLFILYSNLTFAAPQIINYPNMDGRGVMHQGYQILKLALKHSDKEYQIRMLDGDMNDERARISLKRGLIDVADFGYSLESEQEFRTIFFPLDLGLSGLRVLLILKKSHSKPFTYEIDLADYFAGLGQYWSEESIWRDSNLPFYSSSTLGGMFKMLKKNRVDYIPLGINEAATVLQQFTSHNSELVIHPNILIKYAFARMFFVNPEAVELAEQIEIGLHRIYESGELQRKLDALNKLEKINSGLNNKEITLIELDNPSKSQAFSDMLDKYSLPKFHFGR